MKRRRLIASVVGILIAGCTDTEQSDTDTTEDGQEHDDTDTTEAGQNNAGDEGVIEEERLSDVASAQLTTSDLPSGYVLNGEEKVITAEMHSDRKEELSDLGIRLLHERSFIREEGSNEEPNNIFSSIVIYESESDLERGRNELRGLVESENGSIETHSIGNIEEGFIGLYNTGDVSHVLAYSSIDHIEQYLIVSDSDQHYETEAMRLLSLFTNKVNNEISNF